MNRSANDPESEQARAAGAAWEGADLDRPLSGEDPGSQSVTEARRWTAVYRHLVGLEQDLFDMLAGMIPTMPEEAQREAEKTNLPVLATQLARFRHRLEYWIKREEELDHKKAG
jgi:hypothetical protein